MNFSLFCGVKCMTYIKPLSKLSNLVMLLNQHPMSFPHPIPVSCHMTVPSHFHNELNVFSCMLLNF